MSTINLDVDFPTAQSLREANVAFHRAARNGYRPVCDEDGKVVPYPAPYKKSDIFKLADYADIDYRACNVPQWAYDGSLQELVDYLIQGISSEIGKVRVLFRWISNQDVNSLQSYGYDIPSAEASKTWDLYYDLFIEMCRIAGIQTAIITGHKNRGCFEPGDGIELVDRWTAVLINNAYYFVDPLWGSCSADVSSGPWVLVDDNGKFDKLGTTSVHTGFTSYHCDEYWFLTNPEEMIYTCRPFDDRWQLLARPVSRQEFKEMACLEPAFFEYELQVDDAPSRRCVLHAGSGEIELAIKQPDGVRYQFTYKLWLSEKDAEAKLAMIKQIQLDRFAQLEYDEFAVMRCKIRFPVTGKYKVEFKCTDQRPTSAWAGWPRRVCSYIVHAKQKLTNVEPLPANDILSWGPGYALEGLGLKPTHSRGTILSPNGETEVVFNSTKKVHTLATVHSNTRTAEDLKRNVIHFFRDQQLVILARLPEAGEYALNLFATDKGPEEIPPKVCCYLIRVTRPAPIPREFPAIPDGRIGPTDDLPKLAMRPQSHPGAYFEAPPTGETDLIFDAPLRCCFSSRLLLDDKDGLSVVERQVFVENKDNKAVFKTRFPRSGQYVLEIYGAKEVQRNESLPLLFSYIIKASKAMPACRPFPKQGRISTCNGFEVVEPASLSGRLRAKKDVTFRLKVPGASYVAAIGSDNKYAYLSYENGLWKGVVNTGEPTDQFMVAAKLDGLESYTTFLLFNVVEDEIESSVIYFGSNEGRNSQIALIDPFLSKPSSFSYVAMMAPAGHLPLSMVSRQSSCQGQTSKDSNLSRRQSMGVVDALKSENKIQELN